MYSNPASRSQHTVATATASKQAAEVGNHASGPRVRQLEEQRLLEEMVRIGPVSIYRGKSSLPPSGMDPTLSPSGFSHISRMLGPQAIDGAPKRTHMHLAWLSGSRRVRRRPNNARVHLCGTRQMGGRCSHLCITRSIRFGGREGMGGANRTCPSVPVSAELCMGGRSVAPSTIHQPTRLMRRKPWLPLGHWTTSTHCILSHSFLFLLFASPRICAGGAHTPTPRPKDCGGDTQRSSLGLTFRSRCVWVRLGNGLSSRCLGG